MTTPTSNRLGKILKTLMPLKGLRLSIARRAADLRVLHFGAVRRVEGGTVGWDCEMGNLQDAKIRLWLKGYDQETRSAANESVTLVVEGAWASEFGDLVITLSGGYRIVAGPMGNTGEAWRFFRPESPEPHLVVLDGGAIEDDVWRMGSTNSRPPQTQHGGNDRGVP